MPQMKPMNWLFLYMILNLILFFMNIMNYFYFLKMKNFNYSILNLKSYNWKW